MYPTKRHPRDISTQLFENRPKSFSEEDFKIVFLSVATETKTVHVSKHVKLFKQEHYEDVSYEVTSQLANGYRGEGI